MNVEIKKLVVRVVSVTGDTLHLEARGGELATVDNYSGNLRVGDIAYIVDQGGSLEIEAAPSDVWPDRSWIGTVQLVQETWAIVDGPKGSTKVERPRDLDVAAGNTVRVEDLSGICEVLTVTPLPRAGLIEFDRGSEFLAEIDATLTFDDFGGDDRVIQKVRELVELPLVKRDLFVAIGARPIKGVIFAGPPGTGKTMLARIVAAEAKAAFYEIQAPEIAAQWFGQSEKLLRDVFDEAATKDRAIVFFDEIDAIGGHRRDDSHEASRRVVAQLLSLMDGFKPTTNVLVIGTTNRPADLDRALTRRGRFDWTINFDLPGERQRVQLLTVTGAGVTTEVDLPLSEIAAQTEGWSGADIAGIWSEAQIVAVKDGRGKIIAADLAAAVERVTAHRAGEKGAV